MVKKTDDVKRQHRTLHRQQSRELGDWLIARADADRLLHGTRPALAKAATEALKFDVSPSSITTVASGCTLKFARSEAAVKRKKRKAAPREDASVRQARIMRNICEQLTERLPGFQLSARDAAELDDMLKTAVATPVEAAVAPQQQPVAAQVAIHPGQYSAAIAAAQSLEIARARVQPVNHWNPPTLGQPHSAWPLPTGISQGVKQAELPFQEPQ